jgi:hypothetical protein
VPIVKYNNLAPIWVGDPAQIKLMGRDQIVRVSRRSGKSNWFSIENIGRDSWCDLVFLDALIRMRATIITIEKATGLLAGSANPHGNLKVR